MKGDKTMEIGEEFKADVVSAMAHKIRLLALFVIQNKDNTGDNSYRELVTAYDALKSFKKYIEIGE